MAGPHLVYFADPMCSWCWGFSPVISAIRQRFGNALPIRLILGGLRPGTTEPMDQSAKARTREHWVHVHEASGQPFAFAFFDRETFVYDTEPACRAVVAARRRSMNDGLLMLDAIHRAFYAENRDVTQAEVLADLAAELNFDRSSFLASLMEDAVQTETWQDFAITQQTGITGFPTLIAGTGADNEYALVAQGFQPESRILPALEDWLEGAGTSRSDQVLADTAAPGAGRSSSA